MLNINFIVSCFYTKNTPYEEIFFKHLKPSLERLEIPYFVDSIQSKGSWYKNVAMKPYTILRTMKAFEGVNVVGIDVDADIIEFPELFTRIPEEYNIACHLLDWKSWYGQDVEIEELLSGTIFLRNNEKTRGIVERWYERASKSMEWEQKCLQRIVESENIPIYKLPLGYCWIDSLPDGREPLVKPERIVIIHRQASRSYKKLISRL